MFQVKRGVFPKDLVDIKDIYSEYLNSISVSLDFQNNDSELASLAEDYGHDGSGIYLTWLDDEVAGCAAYRRVDECCCEMKRVYVRPDFRGRGIGAMLVEKVVAEAKKAGYKKVYLDVLPEFSVALKLYESLGFKPDKAISINPVPGTSFLSLVLK